MVALDIVHASNAQLRELGPGLVALFVGATSGIGEYTAKAFVKNAVAPHVYIVGRNATAAERITQECKTLNPDGVVEFLKADVSELRDVDRVCAEIMKRETKINLLVQTPGNFNLRGRDENEVGLPKKLSLNYYSRMRFITNLLPLLRNASTIAPHFSRTLSILGAGSENRIDLDDLDLKKAFSGTACANHSIVMNDFMTEEFAAREPGTAFLHSNPSVVNTGLARELPLWGRAAIKALTPVVSLFAVSPDETGARQLFHATSGLYPPAKAVGNSVLAAGTPVPKGISVLKGADGKVGSGGYIVNWNGDSTGKDSILKEYHSKGVGKIVWEHTMGVFERADKISQAKPDIK